MSVVGIHSKPKLVHMWVMTCWANFYTQMASLTVLKCNYYGRYCSTKFRLSQPYSC